MKRIIIARIKMYSQIIGLTARLLVCVTFFLGSITAASIFAACGLISTSQVRYVIDSGIIGLGHNVYGC